MGYLPLVYKVFQTAFLNSFENAMKIVGQMVLIEILFKIFQETLITPMFKVLGKNDNTENNKNYYAKKFLWIYSLICAGFTLLLFLLLKPIMQISHIPEEIFDTTYTFLRMLVIANGIKIIVQYLLTFNIISKETKKLSIYILVSSAATLILDVIFIPSWSLGFGVYGVGIVTLIINTIQLVYLILTMPKAQQVENYSFDFKKYTKLTLLSFFETVTRNLFYYFIILVFINMLNNQGLYYVSNDYIWSIMLIPTLAQNICIKQDISHDNSFSLKPYVLHNFLILGYMLLSVPVAFVLFKYVYKFENYFEYFITLLKIAPCYIIFVFDNVIESYFIATGKLKYVFIQTFITNILVYLTSFIFYITGMWVITLDSIIIVFSAGIIVSSAYTLFAYIYDKKKNKVVT